MFIYQYLAKCGILFEMDNKITFSQIKNKVREMRSCRNWNTGARSAAISVCIEAAELLEHFQWDNQKQNLKEIELEVADVLIYLCDFANEMKIDLSEAVNKKLKKIDEKYPVEMMLYGGEVAYQNQKRKYRSIK